jgi:hypothetical protein
MGKTSRQSIYKDAGAQAADAIESFVRNMVKKPSSFSVEKVRIDGDGLCSFEQFEEEKEDEGRKHEELQLANHMAVCIRVVMDFIWQNVIKRFRINSQKDAHERHESHSAQHGLVSLSGSQALSFAKNTK